MSTTRAAILFIEAIMLWWLVLANVYSHEASTLYVHKYTVNIYYINYILNNSDAQIVSNKLRCLPKKNNAVYMPFEQI